MAPSTGPADGVTVGIDLRDRYSHFCELDAKGDVVEEGRIATVPGRAPRAARAHARPPEDGQGSVSNGPARHVPDAAGSLAHEAAV